MGASSGSCAAAPDLRPYEGPVLGRRACGNARSHRSTSAPSHHHDASRHIEARHSPRQALAKNASMGSSFISNYSPSARDLPPGGAGRAVISGSLPFISTAWKRRAAVGLAYCSGRRA